MHIFIRLNIPSFVHINDSFEQFGIRNRSDESKQAEHLSLIHIFTLFEAGGKEYIALLPLNEDGETEDGDVYLYRYTEDANGEPELENIEDDDEYEIAADAFDEWMDTQEFEESGLSLIHI